MPNVDFKTGLQMPHVGVKYLGALDAGTMGAVGRRLVLALGLEDSF